MRSCSARRSSSAAAVAVAADRASSALASASSARTWASSPSTVPRLRSSAARSTCAALSADARISASQSCRHSASDAASFGRSSLAPALASIWRRALCSSCRSTHAVQPRRIPWLPMRRAADWCRCAIRFSFSSSSRSISCRAAASSCRAACSFASSAAARRCAAAPERSASSSARSRSTSASRPPRSRACAAERRASALDRSSARAASQAPRQCATLAASFGRRSRAPALASICRCRRRSSHAACHALHPRATAPRPIRRAPSSCSLPSSLLVQPGHLVLPCYQSECLHATRRAGAGRFAIAESAPSDH